MSKTNFYTSIFTAFVVLSFLIYEFINSYLTVDSFLVYLILFFIIGELIAVTTTINIQNIIYIRSEEESISSALPRIPFEIKKTLIFIPINLTLLLLSSVVIYYFADATQRVYFYMVLFLPLIIHLIGLIPSFFFKNTELIESNKKRLEENDRYNVIVQIGKKLANKASTSCRKTNTDQFQTILYYLQNGQNPDEIFENRYTLLLPSACCGDEKLVKLLIEYKSDVNFRSLKEGMTALMLASKHGFYDIAYILIQNGADKNIKDLEGKTALEHAQENNFTDIAEMLKEN